jgi:hypothetical protein
MTAPVLSFGPARSIRMRHAVRSSRSAARTWSTILLQAAESSCAQLIRTLSAPAATISRTRRASLAASDGNVTMMRTRRSELGGSNRRGVLGFELQR